MLSSVRYGWDKPNPLFLPALAQARPVFIYAPAHYLKEFHARYALGNRLAGLAAKAKLRSWAALFTRVNDPYDNSNPDMPTLNSWKVITRAPANRFVFERNPYFHRVDPEGQQLPYVDRLFFDLANAMLFAPKASAGDVDLQARGLSMSDAPSSNSVRPNTAIAPCSGRSHAGRHMHFIRISECESRLA